MCFRAVGPACQDEDIMQGSTVGSEGWGSLGPGHRRPRAGVWIWMSPCRPELIFRAP